MLGRQPEPDDLDRRLKLDMWLNFNSFGAKLVAHGHKTRITVFSDHVSRGLHELASCLENAPWESHPSVKRVRFADDVEDPIAKRRSKVHVLDTEVPILYGWIQNASAALWDACVAGRKSEREENYGWKTDLWGRKRRGLGFSMERWAFWIKRLLLTSKIPVLEKETREMAKDMVKMMQEIEANWLADQIMLA